MKANAELIVGLTKIKEGLEEVISNLESEEVVSDKKEEKATSKPVAKAGGKAVSKKVESKEETETKTTKGKVSKDDLDAMSYNNLKKYAKDMGVSANGSRDEITNRILGEEVESEEDEKPVAKAGKTTAPKKPLAKAGKKTQPDQEPEEDDTEDEDDGEDDVKKTVMEAVEDLSNEEIADILADAGISAKGKREALIDKLVKGVIDGKISFDDDDEDDSKEDEPEEKESSSEDDDEEEDDTNDFDNPNMTQERKDAIEELDAQTRKDFKKKEITKKEMVEFLQQFYDTDEDMSDLSQDELLDTYIDAVARLLDDEGNLIEEGSYMLNGEPACCGRLLEYNKKKNKYHCEICDEWYDAE